VNIVVALLLIASMALLAAWILAWPVLGIWQAMTRWGGHRGRAWARYTPIVVVLPVLAGVFLAVAAFVPGDPHLGHMLACHCEVSHPGWLHLCPVHPLSATPLLMLLAIPAALLVFRPVLVTLRLQAGLQHPTGGEWSDAEPDGIRLLDLGVPLAFTSGLWRPYVAADRHYWSTLDGNSRRIIAAHEDAHVRRRDPLTRAWLAAWTAFQPGSLARPLIKDWLEHAEIAADRHAAAQVGDPLLVADVLVRQRRLQTRLGEPAMAWATTGLERRVRSLLSGDVPGRIPLSDLDLRLLAGAAGASSLLVMLSPWLHHNLEHLINTLL
jgi:hypothetical protein